MSSVASQQTRQGWHCVLVGGIATFMGAPQVEADADALRAAGVKAAFLGMPFDSTTIARPGAQLGPRAVRDWSSHLLSYHGEYDLDIFEALGVADMGDVAVGTTRTITHRRVVPQESTPWIGSYQNQYSQNRRHAVETAPRIVMFGMPSVDPFHGDACHRSRRRYGKTVAAMEHRTNDRIHTKMPFSVLMI